MHLVMLIFSKNPEKCTTILELLALNGAKVNQKNPDQWAPLHTAVRKSQEKAIKAILEVNKILSKRNLETFDVNVTGGAQ